VLKISYAGSLGPSLAILAQLLLLMYVTARDHQKFTKNLYFGCLRSFKVIDVITPKKLVTSDDEQHVCVYL